MLCREPSAGGDTEVEVILSSDGIRDLMFSREVVVDGTIIGRESLGLQSRVRCRGGPRGDCVALGATLQACSALNASACSCRADVSQLPELPYQQTMLVEAAGACKHSIRRPFRVLVIGLGGGALPMYMLHHCEAAFVESVELDARVVAIAERLLGFRREARNVVEVGDGLAALQRRASQATPRYDRVLVDCFGGGHVPPNCRSQAFVEAARAVLAPGGRVVQNALEPEAAGLLAAYRRAFGGAAGANSTRVRAGQHLISAWAV